MKRRSFSVAANLLAVSAVLFCASAADAAISMEWVTVGNPGNPADSNDRGAVDYVYRISKTEVTNGQYAAFLNSVAKQGDPESLFPSGKDTRASMGLSRSGSSGDFTYEPRPNMADKAVTFVSMFDAMRFANWMHNGQGSGDTESGVYDMSKGINAKRSDDARFFLPNWDEWYKAAYHDPTRTGGAYWKYTTRHDETPTPATATPTGNIANPGENVAVYGGASTPWLAGVMTVGSADDPETAIVESASYYGTMDQGGNVAEWVGPEGHAGAVGGGFRSFSEWIDSDPVLMTDKVDWEFGHVGFRLAAPTPEPTTLSLLALAAPLLIRRRKSCEQPAGS
jgi:formylglycine-generating enzyme required for sulfatase activity